MVAHSLASYSPFRSVGEPGGCYSARRPSPRLRLRPHRAWLVLDWGISGRGGAGGSFALVLLRALMMLAHFRVVALLRHQAAVMTLGLRHSLLLVSRAHDLAVLFFLGHYYPFLWRIFESVRASRARLPTTPPACFFSCANAAVVLPALFAATLKLPGCLIAP